MPPLSFYCLGVPPTAAAARFCDIVHLAQIQERKLVQNDYLTFSRNYAIIIIENKRGVRWLRGFPRVCHLTRSSRVLPLLVCAFGWVGKGMMCVRAAPQIKNFLKDFKKSIDKQIQMWYNNYRKIRKEVNKMDYISIGTGIYSTKNIQAFRSYTGTIAISYENGKDYLVSVSEKHRKELEEIFKNLLTNEK